jgi:hypothetical protein
MTLKVAGDKVRLDLEDIGSMMGGMGGGRMSQMGDMSKGAYILVQPNGKVAVIMPNAPNMRGGGTGMGISMDMSAMSSGMGMAVPEASDVKVVVEDLGSGGSIHGFPTRKYRIKQTYTATGGGANSPKGAQDVTSEAWFTTSIDGAVEGLKKFSESFGAQFGGGSSARGVVDELRGKMPQGFPLKMISTQVSGGKTTVTTMEVSQVTKTTFGPADLEVPSNIQLLDMSAMMGGRGRGF